MNLNEYLTAHLPSAVMISIKIRNIDSFQYNYWNWFGNSLHLLDNNYKICHIIHEANIEPKEDGSVLVKSMYYPKEFIMNLYFGGAIQ